MKTAIATLGTFALIAFAFLTFGVPPVSHALTTTVTGWLVPDSTHFVNGIGALLFPLIGVGLFSAFPLMLGYRGDLIATMALVGLTIGSVMGMLSLTASGTNFIPFALPVVAAADLVLWLWQGGGR